jgi:hypothetical protein
MQCRRFHRWIAVEWWQEIIPFFLNIIWTWICRRVSFAFLTWLSRDSFGDIAREVRSVTTKITTNPYSQHCASTLENYL